VLGAEQAMRDAHRLPNPDQYDTYTGLIDALRAALGPERFAACWEAGLALPPLGALEEALRAPIPNHSGRWRSRPARRGPITQALTTRQAQIAELVTQGLTNRGIAEALHIKQRTVDEHVSAILARLGVSSRADIPAELPPPH
jgi:non-specific serine/threonine protein kinase